MLKKTLKFLAWTLAALVVLAGAAYWYASNRAMANYHRHWTAHDASFPIPFPLSDAELEQLRQQPHVVRASTNDEAEPPLRLDVQAITLARAVANGKHLVDSRLSCGGCHGSDFGGHAVVDAPFVARWIAPNLTSGKGSVTTGFRAEDWDRAVRHGIRHTGETSSMPVQEFVNLSDHELSDVVAYLRSVPPVDRDLGPTRMGIVFTFLAAFDSSAFATPGIDHSRPHPVEPPAAAVTAEYGEHLVQVCRGCHGPTLSGGKIAGDPNMPEPANLTPHETGLKNWTEADFIRALREGKRKDGTAILEAMPWRSFGQMDDTQLKAIYAYLRTIPARPKGAR